MNGRKKLGSAQAYKKLQELGQKISQIKAVLVALGRMEFLAPGGGPDADDAAHLLARAREDARAADELWDTCEFSWPEPGDQLPPKLIADLIRSAAEARDDKEWQKQALELGDRLYQFALKDRRWMPLLHLWQKVLWSRGVSTGVVAYTEGEKRITFLKRARANDSGDGVDIVLRAQILEALEHARPLWAREALMLQVIADATPGVTAQDIRRELEHLEQHGLVNLDRTGDDWSAELTDKGIDVVKSL